MSRRVVDEVDVAEVQDDGQVCDVLVGQHDLVDAVPDVRRRRKRPAVVERDPKMIAALKVPLKLMHTI